MGLSERQQRSTAAGSASAAAGATKRSSRSSRKADGAAATGSSRAAAKARADAEEEDGEAEDKPQSNVEADSNADANKSARPKREKRAASKQQQQQQVATEDQSATAEDEVKPPAAALAVSTSNDGIPASIRVRIASPPTTGVARTARREEDDEMDGLDAADARAALRIDAATASTTTTTSPTSVASAPTSPADDSGLNTPNTPNGSEGSLAAKRRRLEDPPMFLEKTYEMLEKCAPEIAGWSAPAGESFIVKKPIEFAEHVIPVYFKHKNFSSFVRQLNFYGFRKVRVDAETAASVDPKEWWEFRHDKFVRGRKDLLREIKRRTIADGRSTIERAEMDELRAEVFGLKEQVQQLNKHMMSVMQALMITRNQGGASGSPVYDRGQHQPSTPSSSSTHSVHHPQLPSMVAHSSGQQHHHALLQLHQGLPTQSSKAASSSSSQAVAPRTPVIPSSIGSGSSMSIGIPKQETMERSPATTYQLRPLQSVIPSVHHLTSGPTTTSTSHHVSPVLSYRSGPGSAPAGMSFVDRVDWGSYGRSQIQQQHQHQQQQMHQQQMHHYDPQARFSSPSFPGTRMHYPPSSAGQDRAGFLLPPSSHSHRHTEAGSSSHAAAGFKRIRESDAPAMIHDSSPDAAVRQLSMTASQTRGELLGCIIARILGFIRIQLQQPSSDEVDAVADAVVSDIQQLLARVQEPSSPVSQQQHAANSEAACMYRVEILKFISRELPRAVQDSVEKRIPPHVKKSLNRSLLALLVQKAQAALEHQMRVETAPTPHSSGSIGANATSGMTAHR